MKKKEWAHSSVTFSFLSFFFVCIFTCMWENCTLHHHALECGCSHSEGLDPCYVTVSPR